MDPGFRVRTILQRLRSRNGTGIVAQARSHVETAP